MIGSWYPDDKYDRWWWTYDKFDRASVRYISTNSKVIPDPEVETPSLVMQTAATTLFIEQNLSLSWAKYFDHECVILHFAEIEDNITKTADRREFNIYTVDGFMMSKQQTVVPPLLSTLSIIFSYSNPDYFTYSYYNITLEASSNSTLPPLLNAKELYGIESVPGPTYASDVTAINSIKDDYDIRLGWEADPCLPYPWRGIVCDLDANNISRITQM
ncbi:hypothetical protein LUZ61_011407 [Rhynchospora tenuis]|uniref:Malectin-like domain-containing protein n=1 Tax=Rhynchospora tenuis TaxID=198213 RepID=A0AAD6A0Z8_9POAL|nr:hypothetical protein LUZ61_011407 [Rhynchospora tenuis]